VPGGGDIAYWRKGITGVINAIFNIPADGFCNLQVQIFIIIPEDHFDLPEIFMKYK
jgi:hypothetical protein